MSEPRQVVYAHVDPREPDHIRYVGVTDKTAKARLNSHLSSARRGCAATPHHHWVRELLAAGVEPLVITLAVYREGERHITEKGWIEKLTREGHELTNATPPSGWRGRRLTPEHRQKIRAGVMRVLHGRKHIHQNNSRAGAVQQ